MKFGIETQTKSKVLWIEIGKHTQKHTTEKKARVFKIRYKPIVNHYKYHHKIIDVEHAGRSKNMEK